MPPFPPNTATSDRAIVLFDGACSFCSRTVRFIQRRDRHSRFRFSALQSSEGLELLARLGLPAGWIEVELRGHYDMLVVVSERS